MGNKKNMVWVLEIFTTAEKTEILKVYEFMTMSDIAYVMNLKSSVISNYFHELIKPRGTLKYINIYQKYIVLQRYFQKCRTSEVKFRHHKSISFWVMDLFFNTSRSDISEKSTILKPNKNLIYMY